MCAVLKHPHPSARPLQSRVVGMVLERFCTAAAEDLPAVARFLLQYGTPADGELKKVRL